MNQAVLPGYFSHLDVDIDRKDFPFDVSCIADPQGSRSLSNTLFDSSRDVLCILKGASGVDSFTLGGSLRHNSASELLLEPDSPQGFNETGVTASAVITALINDVTTEVTALVDADAEDSELTDTGRIAEIASNNPLGTGPEVEHPGRLLRQLIPESKLPSLVDLAEHLADGSRK